MDECHLIPFYSKYRGKVKMQYCDLSREKTVIRGVECVKKKVEGVSIYRNGVLLDNCYQWIPPCQASTIFDKGVEMTKSRLGYLQADSTLKHFLKKRCV